MGRTQGAYKAEFRVNSFVRIAPRDKLESFLATWNLHHPVQPEQLAFAGQFARIAEVSFYHGADELYSLEGVPGTWHASVLQTATSGEVNALPAIRRETAAGLGLLSGIGASIALFLVLMFVGFVTGIIAMCSWAPAWVADVFVVLIIAGPAVVGVMTGVSVAKRYLKRV